MKFIRFLFSPITRRVAAAKAQRMADAKAYANYLLNGGL